MAVKYSVIIPVYNRPGEVDELLESLARQTYTNFEVLIIEDGSSQPCENIVNKYRDLLSVSYYFKENTGQGFSRNYGFFRARGEYFLMFDSDCIIPPDYLEKVDNYLQKHPLDAFGGPDKAHPDFNTVQKAISYSMTSFFTTGGIRGRKKHLGTFHPRSFNMGISREVFNKTGGYVIPRLGEDIEFSIRIIKAGFKTGLIPDAYVYHKRRTTLNQFWKQLHFFGRARINIGRFFPSEVKLVHFLPSFFLVALVIYILSAFLSPELFTIGSIALVLWSLSIIVDSFLINRSLKVAMLSVITSFIQLTAYGVGFLTEAFKLKKSPFDAASGK